MKRLLFLLCLAAAVTSGFADVSVKSVEAHQRYPWNGLVDIVVTMEGSAADVANAECSFVATNSSTRSALHVAHITQEGDDSGGENEWVRRFVWDAASDVGLIKIDDVSLTVGVAIGVQLWKDGPRWARCNVGAMNPEESGYYFWWGDTVGCFRDGDRWNAVNGSTNGFLFTGNSCLTSKMNNSELRSSGFIDESGELVSTYDAATKHLGAPWRMPTDAEFATLISRCTSTWTTYNGVYGRLVTGKWAFSSKSIFLPAAGYGSGSSLYSAGGFGFYRSSTPYSGSVYTACVLLFASKALNQDDYDRCYGYSVRPLRGCSDTQSEEISESKMTIHLKVDCRAGEREWSSGGEILRYDASWQENGSTVRITDNGAIVATGNVGSFIWQPQAGSSAPHLLKLEILSAEGQIVGTEVAQFALGYIRNVTARQLWPHNKVALTFTVAEDIGEIRSAKDELAVWCSLGTMACVARRILGDRSARPGIHRIVWDMEADRLKFVNAKTTFGVSVEKIPFGGVQLWENGPYWAECNVGAAKADDSGYYFWWGDTTGYKRNLTNNGWISVDMGTSSEFGASSCPTYGKDHSQLYLGGYVDSSGNLLPEHDAVAEHFGSPWRMPTGEELSLLVSNCTTTWITTNGVMGRLVTGKGAYSSKSIFLPAAGSGNVANLNNFNTSGVYFSSTLSTEGSSHSSGLKFDSVTINGSCGIIRYLGGTVRPVREGAK